MFDGITEPRIETVAVPEHDIEVTLMLTQHDHTLSMTFTNETPPTAVAAVLHRQAKLFDKLATEWGARHDD